MERYQRCVEVVVGGRRELNQDVIGSRSHWRLPSYPTSSEPPGWVTDGQVMNERDGMLSRITKNETNKKRIETVEQGRADREERSEGIKGASERQVGEWVK